MILHIADDIKFIDGAYSLFAKYYPAKNHFFVQVPRNNQQIYQTEDSLRIHTVCLTKQKDINHLLTYAKDHKIKYLFIHYLSPLKAGIANLLKDKLNVKTYWVFYGADLYGPLNSMGMYKLNDEDDNPGSFLKTSLVKKLVVWFLYGQQPHSAFKHFIEELDYFCFWNEYDYNLLKNHFKTTAGHKPFLYYHLINRNAYKDNFEKKEGRVLVNHSASVNGNHKTILQRLKNLNGSIQLSEVIVPLSYGSEKVRQSILEYGYEVIGDKFNPIVNFLPITEYHRILDTIPVAIFGNRRQEAGGTVFYLLGIGSKIYLRNSNNMILWLRDRGFIIFSFEDDLKQFEDLMPLSKEEMEHNHKVFNKVFSEEQEQMDMLNLIT